MSPPTTRCPCNGNRQVQRVVPSIGRVCEPAIGRSSRVRAPAAVAPGGRRRLEADDGSRTRDRNLETSPGVVTAVVTNAATDASRTSPSADRTDENPVYRADNAPTARLRALWTVWSVGVRVSLGALKVPAQSVFLGSPYRPTRVRCCHELADFCCHMATSVGEIAPRFGSATGKIAEPSSTPATAISVMRARRGTRFIPNEPRAVGRGRDF